MYRIDTHPAGARSTVRTTLKNVVINAVIIWLQCETGEYKNEKQAYQAIYGLDIYTPIPSFIPPLNIQSAFIRKRKRTQKKHFKVKSVFISSDGEEEEVEYIA